MPTYPLFVAARNAEICIQNVRQNVGIQFQHVFLIPEHTSNMLRTIYGMSYFVDLFRLKSGWRNLAYLICSLQSSECFLRDWDCRVSVQLLPGARQAATHPVFSIFNSVIYIFTVYRLLPYSKDLIGALITTNPALTQTDFVSNLKFPNQNYNQCCGSGSPWIRTILVTWIRILIKIKSGSASGSASKW